MENVSFGGLFWDWTYLENGAHFHFDYEGKIVDHPADVFQWWIYLLINPDVWTKKGGKSFEYSHVVYVHDLHKIVCLIGRKPTGFIATNRINQSCRYWYTYYCIYLSNIWTKNHLVDPIADMLQKPNHWIPGPKKKDQKKHIDASVFSHLIILSAMAGQESGRRLQTALKPAEGRGFLTPAREAEGSTATNSKSPPENGFSTGSGG